MPISKRNGKYYWGSKGPFNSRKKAEEVAQAAHAAGYEKSLLKLMKAEGNHWSEDEDGGWRVPHPENPFDNIDQVLPPTHPFQNGPRYNPSVLRMSHYATYEGDRNHKMTRLAGRTYLNEDPRAAGEIREGKLDPDLHSFHGFPHTPLQVEQDNFPVPWERSSSGRGGTEREHQLWLKAGPLPDMEDLNPALREQVLYTHPQYAMGDIAGLKDKSMEELNADYPMAHKPVYANQWERGQYAGGREIMPLHSGYHSVDHSAYPDTYQLEQAWPNEIRTRLNTPRDPTDNDSVSHELYRRYHPYQSDDDMRDIYRDGANNFLRCIELGMHMTPGMFLAGLNSMTAHHNAGQGLIHPANPGLDLDRISASGYGVPDYTNYDSDSSVEYTGIAPPLYRKGLKDWKVGDWNHPAILDQYGEPIGSPKPWTHPETHRMMYEVAVAPQDGNGRYHNQIGTPMRGLDYPAGMRFWSDLGGQSPNGYWGNATTQDSYGNSDHPRYQKMPENPSDLLYLWPNEDPAVHLVHEAGQVPRRGRYSSYGPETIEMYPSGDSRNRGIGRQFSSHESTYTPDAESHNRLIRDGHNPQQFGREGYEAGRLVFNRHPSVIRGEHRDGEFQDYDTEALHRGYTHVRPHYDKISAPRDTAGGRLTNRRGAARDYDHRDGDIWSQGDVLSALNDYYGRMSFPDFQEFILAHGNGIRVHPDLHVSGKYLHTQLESRLARTWDTAHLERPDRAPRRGSYDDE